MGANLEQLCAEERATTNVMAYEGKRLRAMVNTPHRHQATISQEWRRQESG